MGNLWMPPADQHVHYGGPGWDELAASVVPCDLSQRLASLDSVVQDLSADVRKFAGGETVGSSAPAAAEGASDASQGQARAPQKHMHHI